MFPVPLFESTCRAPTSRAGGAVDSSLRVMLAADDVVSTVAVDALGIGVAHLGLRITGGMGIGAGRGSAGRGVTAGGD